MKLYFFLHGTKMYVIRATTLPVAEVRLSELGCPEADLISIVPEGANSWIMEVRPIKKALVRTHEG